MKLYQIRPLKWDETGMRGQPVTHYKATAVFGNVYVEQDTGSTRWKYTWCFQEYYDEGASDKTYPTAKRAKAAAEKFYLSRLLPAVQEMVVEDGGDGTIHIHPKGGK